MTGAAVLEGLANAWWQGLLLVACSALGLRLAAGRIAAAERYIVWWLVLVVSVALPLGPALPDAGALRGVERAVQPVEEGAVPVAHAANLTAPPPTAAPADRARLQTDVAMAASPARGIPLARWVAPALLGLWLAISLRLFVKLGGELRRVHRLRATFRLLPAPLRAQVAEMRATSGVKRAVRIGISDAVTVPVTIGMGEPMILLPAALAGTLSIDTLSHLVMHELAHVRRRDDQMLLAERAIAALFFFLPAVHLAGRRLDLERELACDNWVLERTRTRCEQYVRSLLTVGEFAVQRRLPAGALSMAGQLGTRVNVLLTAREAHDSSSVRGGIVFAAAGLLAFVALLGAAPAVHLSNAPVPGILPVNGGGAAPVGTIASRAEALLRRYEAYGFHGAVLIAHRGAVVLHDGFGLADRGRGTPFTAGTAFNGGAVAKMLTAAAILKLEEEGRLKVSDRVADHLGAFPPPKSDVTVHHLLVHTGGLSRAWAPVESGDRGAFIEAMKNTPADYPAGSGHRYTDHGHALLAALIEVVSGMTYEDYVRSALLEPAGMNDTRFESEAPDAAPLAAEYIATAGADTRVGGRAYVWGRRGAMGVITTVEDLWRWHVAMENGSILGADTRRRMLTGWTDAGRRTDIGYGWEVGTSERGTSIRHRLSAWNASSVEVVYDEDEDLFVAFAANAPTNWARPKYTELVNAALGRRHLEPPLPVYPKLKALEPLAGRYESAAGAIDVRVEQNGTLLLSAVDSDAAELISGRPDPATVLARATANGSFAILDWADHRLRTFRITRDALVLGGTTFARSID